jgi:hypothetical protein
LVEAYFECRRHKRNTTSAKAFEANLERNLYELYIDLTERTYAPGQSICFVVTRPKVREIWAATFRDRVVHHLLYRRVAPRFHASFIADSCACIPGRGTVYAVKRLEAKIRSASENWSQPCHYLKLDLANFFVSIDKQIVWELLAKKITEPYFRWLAQVILFHDPRPDAVIHSPPEMMALVPKHKRLSSQPAHLGLPIGNLSSQFFANVLLNALDQHIKHVIGAKHYARYVDDFILIHRSPRWLNDARRQIEAFLPSIGVKLNPSKTILQPVSRGVDFVGQVIKPGHTTTRRRTYRAALARVASIDRAELFTTANSYFGLFRQSTHSHHDRAALAKLVGLRGYAVDRQFTKTFRGAA